MPHRRHWNIDASSDLSDSWTGFHSVHSFGTETSRRIFVVWERLTRKQVTSRTDYLWPELWTKLGRDSQRKAKRKWSHDNPKLNHARKLRGIYFTDLEDKEFTETIKNARKKLETPMALAMLCKTCKISQHGVTLGKSNEIESKLACILEGDESTTMRMGNSIPQNHQDHFAGKETIHYSTTIWFTSLFLCIKI